MDDEIVTADDIMEALEEMGVEFENQEDLDNLIEAVAGLDVSSSDESLFLGGLETTPASQRVNLYQSPIRPRDIKTANYLDTARSKYFSAPQTMRNAEDQEDSDAHLWIKKAYGKMESLYNSIRQLDEIMNDVENIRSARPSELSAVEEISDSEKENVESLPEPRLPRLGLASGRTNYSSSNSGKESSSSRSGSTEIKQASIQTISQGLRPIENPSPGRLNYRCDPVKRWELIREEWARMPPPHEKKRLELRWKVREYMLRKDKPIFDPRRVPNEQPILHDKDWSPKPYLP